MSENHHLQPEFHKERKTIQIELKIRHCGLCTAATEIQLFLMTTTNFLIGQGNFHIFKRNLTTSGQSALPEKKIGEKKIRCRKARGKIVV